MVIHLATYVDLLKKTVGTHNNLNILEAIYQEK